MRIRFSIHTGDWEAELLDAAQSAKTAWRGLRHGRVRNNVRCYADHHQICPNLRNSCIQCVGTQFLRPIETAVLDGDNRILDFDVDTGAMDFSSVNNMSRPMRARRWRACCRGSSELSAA